MSEQKASQEINVTVNGAAAITGANIGNDNQAQANITAGGHVIQAKNSTILLGSDHQTETAPLREAYLNWLYEQASRVSLAGIDRKTASQETCLNLGLIYTALLTSAAEQEREPGRQMERGEKRLSAVAQLNQHRRLVLLGDPGSGKSTFVNFLAMCLAGEALPQSPETTPCAASLDLLTAPLPDNDGKDEKERQPWQHGALLPVRIILRDVAARGLPEPGQPVTAKHFWDFLTGELTSEALDPYLPTLQQQLREQGQGC